MARHIGIVAVSAEGAALAGYMRPIEAGAWDEVGEMLLASAETLRQAGADLLICPDNTAHQGLDLVVHS